MQDALWILPNQRWLEVSVDQSSVQATTYAGATSALYAYLQHGKALSS